MDESIAEWPDQSSPLPVAAHDAAAFMASLEQRVQHLEVEVSSLQDTVALENRVVERVTAHINGSPPGAISSVPTAAHQAALSALKATADTILAAPSPATTQPVGRRLPLLVDLYQELLAISRMFFDLNYKVGWTTRVLVVILIPAILISHWWLPFAQVWIVGEIFDKLIDLVLAFVVFKALTREAQRYRDFRASRGR
jgi:hypothetical protein